MHDHPTSRRRFLQAGSAIAATAALSVVPEREASAATLPVVDVTADGAVGDGVTDDRAAIQSAIAAGSALGPDVAIYFPLPNVAYALGGPLQVPTGCSLVGESGSRSRLLTLAGNSGEAITTAASTGSARISLRNLEVDGQKTARAAVAAPLVHLTAVDRLTIAECWIRNAPAGALQIVGATDLVVTSNEFSGITGTAISATNGVSDGRFLDNFVHHTAGDNIVIEDATRVLVSNNTLTQQSDGRGITLRGVTRAQVTGNLIEHPAVVGILITNSAGAAGSDIAVARNIISGVGAAATVSSTTAGIDLQAGVGGAWDLTAVRVEGNSITTATGVGIRATSLSTSGRLVDVVLGSNHLQCTGNSDATATVSSTRQRKTRTSSSTTSVPSAGISVTGAAISDILIAVNTVVGAAGGGIVLGNAPASVVRPTVRGNRVRDCSGVAIRIVGASAPMITGNRAYSTGRAIQTHGLSVESATGTVNEFGNDFTTSTVAEIAYSGTGAQRGRVSLGQAAVLAGTGDPNISLPAAPIGSVFLRTDGVGVTTLYVRESDAPLSGWVAK